LPEDISETSQIRMCKEASKTVQHTVAGCKMQAGTAYMERHNHVVGIVPKSEVEIPLKVAEG